MHKKYKIIFILLGFPILFLACKGNDQKDIKINNQDSINIAQTINQIYYSLPSPLEIANLIQVGDLSFEPQILLPTNKYLDFQTDKQKSLALGIYAADLSFCTVFNQQQKSLEYFNVIKKLATDLDLINVISDSLMNEIEQNLNNVYKLQQIVGEVLFKTDAILQDSHRKNFALLSIYASWIETLYLSINLADLAKEDSAKTKIYKIIADEYFVVGDLISMLNNSNISDKQKLIGYIETLKNNLSQLVKISYKKEFDPYSGKYLNRKKIEYKLDEKLIKKLKQNTLKIRKNIIEYH